MRMLPKFGWHHLVQLFLDLERCFARREAGPVADAKDMRVNRYGGLSKSCVEDNIGCLASNARQGFQFTSGLRNGAAVPIQDYS